MVHGSMQATPSAPESRYVIMPQAPIFSRPPRRPPTARQPMSQFLDFVARMNSSYGSFDFTGGWQDDLFAETAGHLDGSLSSPTSGRTHAAGGLQGSGTATTSDEWLLANSSWLQHSNVYDTSTPGDMESFQAFPTYTTAQGYTYDADMSDFDQCQSQSSFSEPDFEHLHNAHYGGADCRTNSFSSLPLASPRTDYLHQSAPINAYIAQNQQLPSSSSNFYPAHPTSHPTSTISQAYSTNNAPPAHDLQPSNPLHPRQQPSRFEGDLYTPTYVRGDGPTRAGWCIQCSSWLTLKDSAYWYHMHFAHGISCAEGKHLPLPVDWRRTAGAARGVGDMEALCGGCGRWVLIVTGEKGRTAWWRHAYRCKFKDSAAAGKEKRKGKSASPRKVVARPATGRGGWDAKCW